MKIDFGKTAQDYGRYRAGFPKEFFDRVAGSGFVRPRDRLLDLGTGTGTLARGFAELGCLVTALDPSRPLIDQAEHLDRAAGINGITYLEGRAEAIPLGDHSFDVVTAGQCWHWFNGAKAAAEACRVLRDGGRIIVAHFDWISLPGNSVEATEELMAAHNPNRILAGSGLHPESLFALATEGFTEIETASFDIQASYTHEAWRGRVRAHGGIGGSLGPAEVRAFDAALEQLLKKHSVPDPFSVPHRVWFATAVTPRRHAP